MSETSTPRLREDIVLGPAVRKGPTLVHNVKDLRTGRYLQVGPREHFIMSRLDGDTSLADIGEQYADTFRRRLDHRHCNQILGMLTSRHLLVGASNDAPASEATGGAQERPQRTLLHSRWPLVAPERFFARLEPLLRPVFSPSFVVPTLLAVIGLEIFVFATWRQLFDSAGRLWQEPLAGVATIVLVWLSLAVHEVAHGLTCTRFGGTATEIGIVWRFPILAPYCKVNDVLLFPKRRHRVYTAFAGMFAGLITLLPVAGVWWLTPGTSSLHHMASALLLFGSIGGLSNLIPFLRLDGYAMLNHALGMQDLRTESRLYLSRRVSVLLGRRAPEISYPRGAGRVYAVYGLASLLFGMALTLWFVAWWADLLEPRLGAGGAWAAVVVGCSAAAGGLLWQARRREPTQGASLSTHRAKRGGKP